MCYKCPGGCSACTNETTCTTCDSGLLLKTRYTYGNESDPYGPVCIPPTTGFNCLKSIIDTTTKFCDCNDG